MRGTGRTVDLSLQLALLVLLIRQQPAEGCNLANETQRKYLVQKMLNPSRYDSNILPEPEGVSVTVELTIQDITEINELTSSFKADVWFSQIWRDIRLDFSSEDFCIQNLSLPAENMKKSGKERHKMTHQPSSFLILSGFGSPMYAWLIARRLKSTTPHQLIYFYLSSPMER